MTTLEKGFTIPVLDHGHVIYVDHLGDDHAICAAARVSYNKADVVKTPEDDQRLIDRLYRDRHTSPFEMAKIVFNIKMPIFVARQYVRHRMQNMNEVSARYTKLPDEFYIPEKWRKQDTKNKQHSVSADEFPDPDGVTHRHENLNAALVRHCQESYEFYEELLSFGVAREMARMVLPLNIYTEVRACWDLKNLLHFITLREDAHAQYEIQQYGRAMKEIMRVLFPMVMAAYERYQIGFYTRPDPSEVMRPTSSEWVEKGVWRP